MEIESDSPLESDYRAPSITGNRENPLLSFESAARCKIMRNAYSSFLAGSTAIEIEAECFHVRQESFSSIVAR